uniref:Folate receptor gamma n=1 Tax=Phallusia mammillata TaxID=59560 RepID=A0A6F9DCC4_9ASCI|nr:folate receptor gamma [Phallusia mammillata]
MLRIGGIATAVTILIGLSGATQVTGIHGRTSLLNTCLDGKYHKTAPGPEDELMKCSSWKDNSCCTNHTAFYANDDEAHLYGFNLSHCQNMSQKCKNWFISNNCFYECSPNIGPWILPVKSSFRNEKVKDVPLCKSQCDSWWTACSKESTCVEHWNNGFNWTGKPRAMSCPIGKPCKPFTDIFHNATYFCENIYGPNDYKVVDDKEFCMKLQFTGSNPNIKVAEHYANETTPTPAPTLPPKNDIKDSSDDKPIPPYHKPSDTPPLQVHGTIASIVIAILLVIAVCGLIAYFGIKRCRQGSSSSFTHQGVPTQFPGSIFRPKAFTPVPSGNEDQMAEMSFMQYDDEEEVEPEEEDNSTPKLNGTLQMKL